MERAKHTCMHVLLNQCTSRPLLLLRCCSMCNNAVLVLTSAIPSLLLWSFVLCASNSLSLSLSLSLSFFPFVRFRHLVTLRACRRQLLSALLALFLLAVSLVGAAVAVVCGTTSHQHLKAENRPVIFSPCTQACQHQQFFLPRWAANNQRTAYVMSWLTSNAHSHSDAQHTHTDEQSTRTKARTP